MHTAVYFGRQENMSNDVRSSRHTQWKYHQALKVLRSHPKLFGWSSGINCSVVATHDNYQNADGDENHDGLTPMILTLMKQKIHRAASDILFLSRKESVQIILHRVKCNEDRSYPLQQLCCKTATTGTQAYETHHVN